MGERGQLVTTRSGLHLPAASVERRDPSAATQPLHFMSPGAAQVPEWDADAAFRLGYIANVIAYRCVQLQARDAASVPIVVGRTYHQRTTAVEQHPLLSMFGPPPGGPAPKLSVRKLFRWTHAQQLVTGRRAWEIETDNNRPDGTPVAFWPLAAARLDPVPTTSGTEWFRVFKYGRARSSGEPVRLDPGNVFYGWDPSGLDFRQAESPLQASRFDLSLAVAADRYSLAFLRNNATPATVVTTTAFPTDEHRQAFRRQWTAEFGGVSNAGRTSFHEVGDDGDGPVGEAIDVKVLGLSHKDARLVELRKEALMEVAIGLGVPWSKLDASGRTFDNAEVEDRTYWEEQVLPLLLDFEDDLNMQISPRLGGEVLWFDLDAVRALRRKLFTFTGADAIGLLDRGVIVPNEVRPELSLDGIDGGDEPLALPAPEPAALMPGPQDRGAAGASTREGEDNGNEASEAGSTPPAAAAVPVAPNPAAPDTRDPVDHEARRTKLWRTHDTILRALESRWERAWKRMFAKQAKATLARLNGKRGRQAVTQAGGGDVRAAADEVFDHAFWLRETVDDVTALYEEIVSAGFVRVSNLFGVAFDLEAEWAQTFIQARSNQLAGQVTDTTYTAIRDALAAGVEEGESIPDLARRVEHVFDVASTSRATTIARTEVISGFNGSAHLTATQLPSDVVAGQEWIATRDGRVRPEHAAADGQVIAMDAAFDVGGEALVYPGDPGGSPDNTIQCRCTVAFLTPAEFTERAATGGERRVTVARARVLIDLVHPDMDLLAFRRALTTEAAA